MKKLKDVTLIATDGLNPERTTCVMGHCQTMFDFADSVLIDTPKTYEDAMRCEIEGLWYHIKTSHALFVSHDGWIINPELWDDCWLEYDMIGAPWPKSFGSGNRVGNTGFSLRSRRFLEASARAMSLWEGQPGDVFQCKTLHRPMVNLGMKYASVELAAGFSWENNIEEGWGGPESFGFHDHKEEFIHLVDIDRSGFVRRPVASG
jgi:hypothetical protein